MFGKKKLKAEILKEVQNHLGPVFEEVVLMQQRHQDMKSGLFDYGVSLTRCLDENLNLKRTLLTQNAVIKELQQRVDKLEVIQQKKSESKKRRSHEQKSK